MLRLLSDPVSKIIQGRQTVEQSKRFAAAKKFLEAVLIDETIPDEDNLAHYLQDGVLLCKLILLYKPGSIKKYNPDPQMRFKMIENCFTVVEVCKDISLPIDFNAYDLFNGSKLSSVVDFILLLASQYSSPCSSPSSSSSSAMKTLVQRDVDAIRPPLALLSLSPPPSPREPLEIATEILESQEFLPSSNSGSVSVSLSECNDPDGATTSSSSSSGGGGKAESTVLTSPIVIEFTAPTTPRSNDGDGQSEVEKHNYRQRSFIVHELLRSEKEYIRILEILVNVFLNPMKKLLKVDKLKSIFSTTKNMILINKKMLQRLHDRASLLPDRYTDFCVGDILSEFCTELKNYTTYCNNLENALVTLELCRKDDELAIFLEKSEFTSACGNTNLATLLARPLARIAKYVILIKDIQQYTPETHADYPSLRCILTEMEAMASEVHEARRRSDNLHKILEIQNSISGGERSIWANGRVFLREADFVRIAKMKTQKLHFFLFNDMIVIVSESLGNLWKKPENLFTFKSRILIDDCSVSEAPDFKELRNVFSINLLSRKKKYTLSAASPLEKTLWMSDVQACVTSGSSSSNTRTRI